MKQIIALVLCLILVYMVGLTTFAAGTDDGVISIAEVNEKKYFGVASDADLTVYTAADGSGDTFYDLTKDKQMNICDLVKLSVVSADLSGDGVYGSDDGAIMRRLLIGLREF